MKLIERNIKKITAIAEKIGWSVGVFNYPERDRVDIMFSIYTNFGQDFAVYLSVPKKPVEDFVRNLLGELSNYYNAFDPDYEASIWIGDDGHGKNGAPYHIKDIVDDMQACEDKIFELYCELKKNFNE